MGWLAGIVRAERAKLYRRDCSFETSANRNDASASGSARDLRCRDETAFAPKQDWFKTNTYHANLLKYNSIYEIVLNAIRNLFIL